MAQTFYISPYYRYGTIARYNDPSYTVEFVTQKERAHSEGVLLGVLWNIKGFKRGYIDVNAGPFKKQKEITTVTLSKNVWDTRFEKQETVGCRVGVFLAILLY